MSFHILCNERSNSEYTFSSVKLDLQCLFGVQISKNLFQIMFMEILQYIKYYQLCHQFFKKC